MKRSTVFLFAIYRKDWIRGYSIVHDSEYAKKLDPEQLVSTLSALPECNQVRFLGTFECDDPSSGQEVADLWKWQTDKLAEAKEYINNDPDRSVVSGNSSSGSDLGAAVG